MLGLLGVPAQLHAMAERRRVQELALVDLIALVPIQKHRIVIPINVDTIQAAPTQAAQRECQIKRLAK